MLWTWPGTIVNPFEALLLIFEALLLIFEALLLSDLHGSPISFFEAHDMSDAAVALRFRMLLGVKS